MILSYASDTPRPKGDARGCANDLAGALGVPPAQAVPGTSLKF
jgi:hypothetical protein